MKEIKVSRESKLPAIVGNQVSVEMANTMCKQYKPHCMILTLVTEGSGTTPNWIQVVTIGTDNLVNVFETYIRSVSAPFHSSWNNKPLETFIRELIRNYPHTEFYLIESLQELIQVVSDRCPTTLLPRRDVA